MDDELLGMSPAAAERFSVAVVSMAALAHLNDRETERLGTNTFEFQMGTAIAETLLFYLVKTRVIKDIDEWVEVFVDVAAERALRAYVEVASRVEQP